MKLQSQCECINQPPSLYDVLMQRYRSCKTVARVLCLVAREWLGSSHFCEIHSLSYEASKFFAMLSLCVFFCPYLAPGANIVPPIAYKSHSTRFPIRRHVLTPHSWLCDKNCGRSSAPKKRGIWKWRITLMLPCHIWQAPLISMHNNSNVALP